MAKIGYIQVTRLCNQRCLFCSNPENPRTLTREEARRQCLSLREAGDEWVLLTGGEPTQCPDLAAFITIARECGLRVRMISNGQWQDPTGLISSLAKAGLEHVHLSLHSCRPEVQAMLSGKDDSFEFIDASLHAVSAAGMSCDVNTVICAQNAHHLEETVAWVLRQHPHVQHFVFNNLDPHMNRVEENPHTIPRLPDLELSLFRALRLLETNHRSFRVERLPLCFMADFAHASTETRKIVKGEGRLVHFLDEKGAVQQKEFQHSKFPVCDECTLESICAGLDCGPDGSLRAYDPACLHALFLDPEPIRRRILAEP